MLTCPATLRYCAAANAAVLFFTRELAHREEKEALAQAFVDELCEHKEW